MDKPVSVMIEDAKKELVDCVNRQGINPSIMRYIIKDVLDAVVQASVAEYEADLKNMESKEGGA